MLRHTSVLSAVSLLMDRIHFLENPFPLIEVRVELVAANPFPSGTGTTTTLAERTPTEMPLLGPPGAALPVKNEQDSVVVVNPARKRPKLLPEFPISF
jgi:hypothetical protein